MQIIFPPVGVSVADLRLESLLIIQELCGASCQLGDTQQESPASSRTEAQAEASAVVIHALHLYLSRKRKAESLSSETD